MRLRSGVAVVVVGEKKCILGGPVVAQGLTNPTRDHGLQVQSLASLSGLRIRRCRELWCRSKTQLDLALL